MKCNIVAQVRIGDNRDLPCYLLQGHEGEHDNGIYRWMDPVLVAKPYFHESRGRARVDVEKVSPYPPAPKLCEMVTYCLLLQGHTGPCQVIGGGSPVPVESGLSIPSSLEGSASPSIPAPSPETPTNPPSTPEKPHHGLLCSCQACVLVRPRTPSAPIGGGL